MNPDLIWHNIPATGWTDLKLLPAIPPMKVLQAGGVTGPISRSILFIVDGKLSCGHYHQNGYFYSDERPQNRLVEIASSGAQDDYKYTNITGPHTTHKTPPRATAWAYLREEP